MFKVTEYKSKRNILTFMFKNVSQSVIIGIALLVSCLINLPRVLQLFNIVDGLAKSFASASVNDIIVRVLFVFFFSWATLQFNINWKFLYKNLNRYLKLIVTIGINAGLLFASISIFINSHQFITGEVMNSPDKGLAYFVYFVILLILIFIARILRFQIIHQEDVVEKELLKQQALQNELSALKNQIKPHFLFNSLNSLNSLIRGNKEATTFVNKLSFMYRYILQSGQQNLISLKEELMFLESYTYLIKTRYRDCVNVEIDINDKWFVEKIPVLSLQLLVENAVKHNEISEENPLLIKLYVENEFLIVENKVQARTSFVDSTGHGLENIDQRFFLLKEKHIVINNVNNLFKVKLPIN